MYEYIMSEVPASKRPKFDDEFDCDSFLFLKTDTKNEDENPFRDSKQKIDEKHDDKEQESIKHGNQSGTSQNEAQSGKHENICDQILAIENRQCDSLLQINYCDCGVSHVYNPLDYASETHSQFVKRYGNGTKKLMFLGMNPGPYGMAQNGIPFGDITHVRDWLQITGAVLKPTNEHPKKQVLGFQCTRNEVSGTRFWGLVKTLAGVPDTFFKNCYVHNYCSLCFLSASGKNVTPPSLKKHQRDQLQDICDRSLVDIVELLQVNYIIGVGKYAEQRARYALKDFHKWKLGIFSITHPSPINPAANRGNWDVKVTEQLKEMGVVSLIKSSEELGVANVMTLPSNNN